MSNRTFIVPTNVPYTSDLLNLNLNALKSVYPFLNMGSIGVSRFGKTIPYVIIGRGSKQIFYNASFHANEWITSVLLMKFIEDFCYAYKTDSNIYEYSARSVFEQVSLYLVPMVNPDGVDLVTGNISSSSSLYQTAKTIASSFPNIPFPDGWKANLEGVDLNLQFPAAWEQARQIKFAQGFTKPAPRDYVGSAPLVAPEARAVYDFTLQHNFSLIQAYHSQGQVIYWKFLNFNPPNAEQIGKQFSASSGYSLEDTPYLSSFAGYKDWFIQNYNLPGYTIEVGLGENPLPISQFDTIYQDILGILVLGMVLG